MPTANCFMFSFSDLTTNLNSWLSARMGATSVMLVEMTIVGILAISLFAFLGLLLVYMERKVAAFIAAKVGSRTG